MTGSLWSLLTVLGPILLGAILLWAVLSNRRSKAANDRTESATHDLYKKMDREDKSTAADRRDA
jgi:hypothetical protein